MVSRMVHKGGFDSHPACVGNPADWYTQRSVMYTYFILWSDGRAEIRSAGGYFTVMQDARENHSGDGYVKSVVTLHTEGPLFG